MTCAALKYMFFFHFKAPECGKHALHYGGVCCYSCRAFFRRAHQDTKTPNFICRTGYEYSLPESLLGNNGSGIDLEGSLLQPGSQGCGIDVKTKRQCRYHRLRRCIEIGRNPFEIS